MRVFIVQSKLSETTLDFNIVGVFNTNKEAHSYVNGSKSYDKRKGEDNYYTYKISSHIVG